jgi:hypothetical protein
MSIRKTRIPPARDADASDQRQALISNRHEALLDDRGDTPKRIEPLARLGEPVVGEPWPSDIQVNVEYRFDREPASATRSLGIQVHISKRSIMILVLTAILAGGAFGRNTTLVKKILTMITKVLR